jgi:hypothetical protein
VSKKPKKHTAYALPDPLLLHKKYHQSSSSFIINQFSPHRIKSNKLQVATINESGQFQKQQGLPDVVESFVR